jgi:PAS domain S-box-containing protein
LRTLSTRSPQAFSTFRPAWRRDDLEELAATSEIYRLLVEGTKDYAIFMLSAEGNILTWNSGAQRTNGYRAEEVIGRHFSIFYMPEDRGREKPQKALRTAAQEGRYEEEGWRLRKDGTPFWASIVMTALYDDYGAITGFSKVTRDVTDQRRSEEALRLQAAELERRVEERTALLRSTNAQLETFVYSVSHDLRSPLHGLQGIATALLEDYGDRLDDLGREYARTLVDSAKAMEVLVKDLLAYSLLGGALLPVDLDTLLHEVLGTMQPEIARCKGSVSIRSPLPVVLAHRTTLVRVFASLVSNALKYMPPGMAPRICIEAEARGPFVRLWVRDNGIGISPEFHQRIFKVFERLHTTEAFPGTGVGLAIVIRGVESMGGRVGVESEPGKGSSFWMELPRQERKEEDSNDPGRRGQTP